MKEGRFLLFFLHNANLSHECSSVRSVAVTENPVTVPVSVHRSFHASTLRLRDCSFSHWPLTWAQHSLCRGLLNAATRMRMMPTVLGGKMAVGVDVVCRFLQDGFRDLLRKPPASAVVWIRRLLWISNIALRRTCMCVWAAEAPNQGGTHLRPQGKKRTLAYRTKLNSTSAD